MWCLGRRLTSGPGLNQLSRTALTCYLKLLVGLAGFELTPSPIQVQRPTAWGALVPHVTPLGIMMCRTVSFRVGTVYNRTHNNWVTWSSNRANLRCKKRRRSKDVKTTTLCSNCVLFSVFRVSWRNLSGWRRIAKSNWTITQRSCSSTGRLMWWSPGLVGLRLFFKYPYCPWRKERKR